MIKDFVRCAVRITHIPTGIVIHIEDRQFSSLARLYKKALRILRTRLYALRNNLPGAKYITKQDGNYGN